MAADVGEELFERIRADFEKKYKSHAHAQSILKRIERGTADQIDLNSYARSLGHCLAEAIEENITPADLPNETMYYNIAQKILEPMLRQNHQLVNQAADTIQRRLDQGSGIHIRPQTAPFPDDRVQDVLWKVYHDGADAEKAVERMSRASDTITRSFADDFIEENARTRTEAGIQCYIVRISDGEACEFCTKYAGRFRYPEGTPEEVFQRHDNCGCSVTYECGEMRQDVHSKKVLTAEEAEAREKSVPARVRYTPAEGAALEAKIMSEHPKTLDKSGESGIIGLRAKVPKNGFIEEHDEPVLVGHIDVTDAKAVQRSIKEFEDEAVHRDIETARVITKNGDVIDCFGVGDSVYPDADLGEEIRGAVISHNHTMEETEYSFSESDVQLFQKYDIEELRGCDEKYVYVLTRNPDEIDDVPEDWYEHQNVQHTKIIEIARERGYGYRRYAR